MSSSGRSATAGSRLFISMRRAASWCQPLQESVVPVGAVMGGWVRVGMAGNLPDKMEKAEREGACAPRPQPPVPPWLPPCLLSCNLLSRQAIQPLAMTPPATGAATLQHESIGRTDPDAVDVALAASGDAHAFERLYR